MNNPDREGYYAFEGKVAGATVEQVQWIVYVCHEPLDDEYYAHQLHGYPHKLDMMVGEWTLLRLPWDTETVTTYTK